MKKILQIFLIATSALNINAWSQNNTDSSMVSCKSDFTYEVNNLVDLFAAGVPMNFYDKSIGTNLQYFWDFGDGYTSEEQNPMHIFSFYALNSKIAFSPYATVCLSVYNDECKDINCKYVPLTTDTIISQTCNVWFNYKEIYGADSDVVSSNFKPYQFEGVSQDDVISWHWNIDDSLDSYEQNPLINLPKKWNNEYYSYGSKVTLTILTDDSCSSSSTQFIPWSSNISECWVYFIYHKDDSLIVADSTITLHFSAIADRNVRPLTEGEKIVSWRWDFGDGTISEEESPSHAYKIADIRCGGLERCIPQYYVCVTVTNANGCTTSYCDHVFPEGTPQPSCQAKFSYTVSESFPPIYNFSNNSEWHGGLSFWSFGDGTFSYETNPQHVFKAFVNPALDSSFAYDVIMPIYNPWINYYTVCLTISDSLNCTSTYCETISAYPDSSGSLCNNYIKLTTSSLLGNSSCEGTASADLVNVAGKYINVASYKWSTGETTQSINNLCANNEYSVAIIDENGCYTAGSFAITDYSYPWNYPGDWKYEGKDSTYIFKYMGNNPDYVYSWNFSDGYSAIGTYVPHTFNSSTGNWVELVIYDNSGNEIDREKIMLPAISTNIKNKTQNNIANIFPNPASEKLYIDLKNANSNYSIDVIDITGRIQNSIRLQNSNSQYIVDIKELPKGMYICRIKAENKSLQSIKFIKY